MGGLFLLYIHSLAGIQEIQCPARHFFLQNLLQLPAKKRNQTMDLVETIDSEEEEKSGIDHQVGVFREIIKVVVADDRGQDLLGLLGDNDALVIELVSAWMDSSQLGEAERSSK